MELEATSVFELNWNYLNSSNKKYIVNQGSSRSSKTYSLCQCMILYALSNKAVIISIVRKTFPTLRSTAMRMLINILKECGIYKKNNHNKTENTYIFSNGSMIEFFSADDEQKLRGRERDICWVNEANELLFDDYIQLDLRTKVKMIFDYNPSDSYSWLYEINDYEYIHSTYLDNPYLNETTIKTIESLKDKDDNLWKIFGLGIRGISRQNVFVKINYVDIKPEQFTDFIYGLDFGFNDETALVKVWYNEAEIYIETLIYESNLNPNDLIYKLKELRIEKDIEIIADSSRPELISMLKESNYTIIKCKKGDGSIQMGINLLLIKNIYINNNDRPLKIEFENYRYKKIGDKITDNIIDSFNHAIDALRYANTYITKNLGYGDLAQLLNW